MNNVKAAELLAVQAKKWGDEAIGTVGSLAKAYRDDEKQLMKVVQLLKANKIKQARKKASDLDTIVRDVIPTEVYDWLFDEDNEDNE